MAIAFRNFQPAVPTSIVSPSMGHSFSTTAAPLACKAALAALYFLAPLQGKSAKKQGEILGHRENIGKTLEKVGNPIEMEVYSWDRKWMIFQQAMLCEHIKVHQEK